MTNLQIETEILNLWFGPEPQREREVWFKRDPAFDAEIEHRFKPAYEAAAGGRLDAMAQTPRGCLALIILLDQIPRNLFRDDGRAFATDAKALALAKRAIDEGVDRDLTPLERKFLYMPFQHSENLADQRRSVELFAPLDEKSHGYAVRHLEIIERFGRFPHRNAVLGRAATDAEAAFLKEPDSSF